MRLLNVRELELGFWGLVSLGGLDDLWEAEVFDHKEVVTVERGERIFQGESRALDRA